MEIIGFLLLAFLIGVTIYYRKNPTNAMVKEIHNCENVKDAIQTIGYGRVYPYYTGMKLEDVKKIVEQTKGSHKAYEEGLMMMRMMGLMCSLPIPSPDVYGINDIRLHFGKYEQVTSITLPFNDKQTFLEACEYLKIKFGTPYSSNKEFVIWRNKYMVINITWEDQSINIIDERFF